MNISKQGHTKAFGGTAVLALLLALTGCGGSGGGSGEGEIAAKGPPSHSNSGGASIDVSNTCGLASDTDDKPVLRVTTTITDKSSGDLDNVYFTLDGTRIRATEKGSGRGEKYLPVGDIVTFTGSLGDTVTDIQLCAENGAYLGPDNTVSLNASVSVSVDNDNKGEYSNRCSDDPATEGIDEGKVVVSSAELNLACGNL